jgi:hypothetical protein
MPYYAINNNQKDYQLFLDFKKTFFINGCSYFDKSLKVVTKDNLDEFEKRFIINYISGNEQNFNEKAIKQLSNSSKTFKHLFSNYIWLYNLFFLSYSNGNYKISKSITAKYSENKEFLGEDIEIDLIPKFGFALCGPSYNTRKDAEICYIHIFIKEIFRNPSLLSKEEELIKFIKDMNVNTQLKNYVGVNLIQSGIKNILLFLLMPHRFEPIVSYNDKKSIVNGFGEIDSKKDIDTNLLLIREKFNIVKSFYEDEYLAIWANNTSEEKSNSKRSRKARVVATSKNTTISKKIKLKTDDDLHEEYSRKLKTGQNAEELVFLDLKQRFMSNKKDTEYIKIIFKALCNLYPFEEVKHLVNKSLKEISMFSKHVYTNAPFDIIYFDGIGIKFVEVKNCSSSPYKIYMSVGELKFAYDNYEQYKLKVVINDEILELEDLPIEQLYNQVTEINSSNSLLSISNFELFIEVD